MLNDPLMHKTEVALFASPHVARALDHVVVQIGDSSIESVSRVRNLGVQFDVNLTMDHQVSAVCRSAYAQLRNIGLIRHFLPHQQLAP
jgi:hypothetical protein